MRSASITVQTQILNRFDQFLLSSIKILINSGGISYELLADRKRLKQLGFVFTNSDEFLPRREFFKLLPLLEDKKNILPEGTLKRQKGRVDPSPLLKAFCFVAHAPTRPSFFTSKPLWMHHSVSLSQAVSTAFESLELPLIGAFIALRNNHRFVVREGSSVRGVLVSHYLQAFSELSLPYCGLDHSVIKCIKSSFYKFLVRTVNNYQLHSVINVVGSWPKGRTFSIIPRASWRSIQDRIMRSYDDGPTRILQLSYCISQSKSICEPVSASFIRDSLENHCDLLCRKTEDRELSVDVLRVLEEVGSDFGDVVARHYRPYFTVPPNSSACFERNRLNGGLSKYIDDHFSSPPKTCLRCEPLVIGLFGPPGAGKSTFLYHLLGSLEKEFQIPSGDDGVYFRNPHQDHWDGYKGQFIVVIDDFGQDIVSSPDLREFDQMVSCSTFYPPMAHLDSKGIKFCSQLVILTSNLTYGQRLIDPTGAPILIEPLSVWRRIHLPYLIMHSESKLKSLCGRFNHASSIGEHLNHGGHKLDTCHEDLLFSSTFSSTPLFYQIIPKFGDSGKGWTTGLGHGALASVRSHLPPGPLPSELSFLDCLIRPGSVNLGYELKPPSSVYDLTDPRNTGCNTVTYGLDIIKDSSSIIRQILSSFSSRQTKHFSQLGVWPQTIVDENIDFIIPDFPDPELISVSLPLSESSYSNDSTLGGRCFGDRFDLPSAWRSKSVTSTSIPVKKVLYFPTLPDWSLPPKVKAIGLAEPLKCRVITVPEAKSRCLKPFQMAMHKALSFYPQFSLTHSAYWDLEGDFVESTSVRAVQASLRRLARTFLLDPSRLCLSGDYAAATDNFIIEVSQVLLRSILSKIDHQPTHEWAWWEISPARICYPFGSFMQQRGQRMGSLLSFPLLCLANEALCRLAKFDPNSYLINGDDLAASVTLEQHDLWKIRGSDVGLVPNEKYFISSGDRKFLFINSQLFDVNLTSILPAGKLSCMVRRDKPLASCLEYLQRYYSTSILRSFCRLNHTRLSLTPCSPFVPIQFGGLGLVFSPGFSLDRAKKVYLLKLWMKVWKAPQKIPGTHFSICTVPVLWSDNIDTLRLSRDRLNWQTREEIAEFQLSRTRKFADLGYSRAIAELNVGEVLDFQSILVDDPWSRRVVRHDQVSHEFLGSRPDCSPWYSDVHLDEDPLESVYILLCRLSNTEHRNSDAEIRDDYSWKDYDSDWFSLSNLLTPVFKEWVQLRKQLNDFPPLTIFSTRFILCPSRSIPLLRRTVLTRLENYLSNENVFSLQGPESYKEVIDGMLNDQENPIFTRDFLQKWCNEAPSDVDFTCWNSMVLGQISSICGDDFRYLLPSCPLDLLSSFGPLPLNSRIMEDEDFNRGGDSPIEDPCFRR